MTIHQINAVLLDDEEDVAGHGISGNHNETLVLDDEEDVAGHGISGNHHETLVLDDEDDVGHGTDLQHNETLVRDDEDDEDDVAGHGFTSNKARSSWTAWTASSPDSRVGHPRSADDSTNGVTSRPLGCS